MTRSKLKQRDVFICAKQQINMHAHNNHPATTVRCLASSEKVHKSGRELSSFMGVRDVKILNGFFLYFKAFHIWIEFNEEDSTYINLVRTQNGFNSVNGVWN